MCIFSSVSPHFMEEQKMLRNSAVVRPVGSSVRLRCRADGNPPPHVLWIRDSMQGKVTLESTEDEEDSNKRKWTLKLRNLQEEDSGTYVCKVTNRLGTINFTYSLEVIGRFNGNQFQAQLESWKHGGKNENNSLQFLFPLSAQKYNRNVKVCHVSTNIVTSEHSVSFAWTLYESN